jgi:hypothetical protein
MLTDSEVVFTLSAFRASICVHFNTVPRAHFNAVSCFYFFSYFIPEDGDTEQAPNVFLAPKPSRPGYPPLLGQIKAAFPLPGKYHFRFKTTLVPGYDKGPVVWMDALDNNEPVPVLQNVIVAKVTRVAL